MQQQKNLTLFQNLHFRIQHLKKRKKNHDTKKVTLLKNRQFQHHLMLNHQRDMRLNRVSLRSNQCSLLRIDFNLTTSIKMKKNKLKKNKLKKNKLRKNTYHLSKLGDKKNKARLNLHKNLIQTKLRNPLSILKLNKLMNLSNLRQVSDHLLLQKVNHLRSKNLKKNKVKRKAHQMVHIQHLKRAAQRITQKVLKRIQLKVQRVQGKADHLRVTQTERRRTMRLVKIRVKDLFENQVVNHRIKASLNRPAKNSPNLKVIKCFQVNQNPQTNNMNLQAINQRIVMKKNLNNLRKSIRAPFKKNLMNPLTTIDQHPVNHQKIISKNLKRSENQTFIGRVLKRI